MIYHQIFFVLGPFTIILLFPFEKLVYFTNMGFVPTSKTVFYPFQLMLWGMNAAAIYFWVTDRFFSDKEPELPLFPLILLQVLIWTRTIILATRYGN